MANCWFCSESLSGEKVGHWQGHPVHSHCLRTHNRDRKVMSRALKNLKKTYAYQRAHA